MSANDLLRQEGFEPVGKIIGYVLEGRSIPNISGVYAFVTDSEISYVGVAEYSLARRLQRYPRALRNPNRRWALLVVLREWLQAGRHIDVWICTDVSVTTSRGHAINGAKAIEADLIKRWHPRWNILGIIADNDEDIPSPPDKIR